MTGEVVMFFPEESISAVVRNAAALPSKNTMFALPEWRFDKREV